MSTLKTYSLALAAMPLIWLAGCASDPKAGYTTVSMYPTDVHSIAVSMWTRGKDVYRREYEKRLTEAVIKRIQIDTPYQVLSRARANTLLEGSIEEIDQRILSVNTDTGVPRELEITFYINFTWTDLRTGKVKVERKHLKAASTRIQETPFDEDFFEGSEDVINRVAMRVVQEMEKTDWAGPSL